MIVFFVGLGVFVLVLGLVFGRYWPLPAAGAFVLALILHILRSGEPLASPFQTGMLISLGLLGVGHRYAWRPRLVPLVRAAQAAAAFTALFSLHYLNRFAEGLSPGLLAVHAGSFLLAYVALTIAYIAALLGYVQHLALKRRPWRALSWPPLLVLMGLEGPYLRFGYLAYTFGLFTGMAWAFRLWGQPLSWDPKEVTTLFAWSLLTLRVLLPAKTLPGIKIAVWTLAFVVIVLVFLVVPLFGGRHPV